MYVCLKANKRSIYLSIYRGSCLDCTYCENQTVSSRSKEIRASIEYLGPTEGGYKLVRLSFISESFQPLMGIHYTTIHIYVTVPGCNQKKLLIRKLCRYDDPHIDLILHQSLYTHIHSVYGS